MSNVVFSFKTKPTLLLLQNPPKTLTLARSLHDLRRLLSDAESEAAKLNVMEKEDDDDDVDVVDLLRNLNGEKREEWKGGGGFGDGDVRTRWDELHRKVGRHQELIQQLLRAENTSDFCKWMVTLSRFEEKTFRLPFGNGVMQMVNQLSGAKGDERMLLLQKIDQAIRNVQCQRAHDPKYSSRDLSVVQNGVKPSGDVAGVKKQKQPMRDFFIDEEQEQELDAVEMDDILLHKLNAIESKVEEKLAKLHSTSAKKAKATPTENASTGRNSSKEQRNMPGHCKGFDVKFINVHRTRKVTKTGQMLKYKVLLACGNYRGVFGFARAEDSELQSALEKTYEKCFQNLYSVERHEERTIASPIQSEYEETKIFLWPAPAGTGMKGHHIVETILDLAGFKDVRSKIIGWKSPLNTVMALLKALNATEMSGDDKNKNG